MPIAEFLFWSALFGNNILCESLILTTKNMYPWAIKDMEHPHSLQSAKKPHTDTNDFEAGIKNDSTS